MGDFPSGPAKSELPMQGAQIWSLIRELDPTCETKSLAIESVKQKYSTSDFMTEAEAIQGESLGYLVPESIEVPPNWCEYWGGVHERVSKRQRNWMQEVPTGQILENVSNKKNDDGDGI